MSFPLCEELASIGTELLLFALFGSWLPQRHAHVCDGILKALDWREMAAVRTHIGENDYVELVQPVGVWAAGIRGTAVSDYGAWKLIEISDDRGQMLDLIEVAEADLRLISQHP